MSGKYALIIGNTEYTDPGLAQLTAPRKDVDDFVRVLKNQEICAFDDVKVLLNQPEHIVRRGIDIFFDQKKPDDLLILYFSGHGVRDELGVLYLAVKNTSRNRLRSTAIKSNYIREAMDQSRSKRQVLILDCCNSGAFEYGTKAAIGASIGTASAFEAGYGRIILTASDATQFAWEGDKVIGEKTDNSLFTHFLVSGLDGAADLDGDGRITVDELYDYAYEKVKLATSKQTPSKFSSKQQGEIVLRHNIRLEDTKPAPLPEDLTSAIKSSLPFVREGAVRQLDELLKGKNARLAQSAREALMGIAVEDDSRTVALAAKRVLESASEINHVIPEQPKEHVSKQIVAQQGKPNRTDFSRNATEKRRQEQSRSIVWASQAMGKSRKTKWTIVARTILLLGIASLLLYTAIRSAKLQSFVSLEPTRIPNTEQLLAPSLPLSTNTDIAIAVDAPTPTPENLLFNNPSAIPSQPETRARVKNLRDDVSLIYIPPGEFNMGVKDEQIAQLESLCLTESCKKLIYESTPDHKVKITKGYWIYSTEVSNSNYTKCLQTGFCTEPKDDGVNYTKNDYFDTYPNYPVVWIEWAQAETYCEWAGGRLPTNAEWEYAARGDNNSTQLFPWGDKPPTSDLANVNNFYFDLKPVDSFADSPSPFGLLNMAGNVWEWVSDYYDSNYYKTNTDWTDPKGPNIPDEKDDRVIRGGSAWFSSAYASAAVQDSEDPVFIEGHEYYGVGFRCVTEKP